MPMALPVLAGAFLAAGSIAAVTLGTAFVVAGLAITWAAVLTVTGVALMAISALARKTPKPDSGSQLQQKLDPQAPVPIIYGRTAVGGIITWRGTYGSKNKFYGIVTALSAGGPIAGVEAYRAGDYPVTWSGNPATGMAGVFYAGTFALKSKLYRNNKLRQRWQSGDAPASTTPGGASGIPQITAGKMSGIAHVITQYEYDTDAFPQGLPQSMWIAKGVKLYDPRRDSTYPGGSGGQRVDQPSTWTYSENPYLAALQWTLGRYENGKRVFGIGAKWSEVDVASFVAGANTADANGWKVGGQVTTGDDKFAVLASLLVAGGGQAIARGAQIACVVNSPKASILTLTREDIVGDAEIASSTSWRDRQNSIIPRYREESQNWELISGERVSAAQYVSEDDGEIKTVEIEFPLVQQAFQAHQLAAYELVNSREMLTFTLKCKMRALAARVGDAINIDIPEFATSNQKALVVGREFSTVDQSVVLSVKSETDAKHAFALGQTQVAPPSPKLDGYDPSAPDAPEANAWSITATQISTASTTIPALVVSGAPDDPNTRVIIVEYRPVGSSVWLSAGDYPANTTRVEITSVTAGTAYEVAVSYRTVLNVVGERLVLNATTGALTISYGTNLSGQPTKLTDINVGEGGKLSGIAPGADVTGNNTSKDTNAVGGRPSSTVLTNIDNAIAASNTLQNVTIPAVNSAVADALDKIARARTDFTAADTVLNSRADVLDASSRKDVSLMNANGNFSDWPLANAFPTGWGLAASGPGAAISRGPGSLGRFAMDSTVPAGSSLYIAVSGANFGDQYGGVDPGMVGSAGWYVFEMDVTLLSGSFGGSGIYCAAYDSAGNGLQTTNAGFATSPANGGAAPGSGIVGERYRYSILTQFTVASTKFFRLHPMTGWPGFPGGAIPAVSLRWHSVGMRPATAGEVAGGKAQAALPDLSARIKTTEDTLVDLPNRYAAASRATTLEAQLNRTAPSAVNNSLDYLDGRITSTASTLTSTLSARIEDRATVIADQKAGAVAQTVSQLRSEYNGTAATVSQQAGTISGLTGKTAAYWQVTADAGNNRAQLTVRADSYGSAGVDIVGDVQIKGANSNGRTIISGAGVEVYDQNNIRRVRLGIF